MKIADSFADNVIYRVDINLANRARIINLEKDKGDLLVS
jgi:hypothetical protein